MAEQSDAPDGDPGEGAGATAQRIRDAAQVRGAHGDFQLVLGIPVLRFGRQGAEHQAAVGEADGGGIVGVVDGRDEVTVGGEFLGQAAGEDARGAASVAQHNGRTGPGGRAASGTGVRADVLQHARPHSPVTLQRRGGARVGVGGDGVTAVGRGSPG